MIRKEQLLIKKKEEEKHWMEKLVDHFCSTYESQVKDVQLKVYVFMYCSLD